jgi:leader peptidase (prepilin peptidase) / N-methyltransferase
MIVSPLLDAGLAAVIGLLVGSFLNVVIYRLPQMLERQWEAECAVLGGQPAPETAEFNLMRPRSRCRQCGHVIRWYENVPVLSYLALRGKCSACGAPIGLRYPLVELATAALFFLSVRHWGATPAGAAWCAFSAALVTLALIDWDTTLLPDDITLPLVWAGLILAALRWIEVPLTQALWGAVAGYVSLWLVYKAFKLLTGKEGMGYGDFKLLAALGAWFGWQSIPAIILLASIVGALVGIALMVFARHERDNPIPFGPYLAGAGVLTLFFSKPLTALYGLG